ncbi:hypothetical protein ACHAQJ_004184 [Trichoderma viride]
MEVISSNSSKFERRKLRRGTTSCWECKRRKTQCHFEQGNSSICVSCKRRGCKCVPQNIDEKNLMLETADQRVQKRDLREQMDHLETLVNRLVHAPANKSSTRVQNSDARLKDQTAALEKESSIAVNETTKRHDMSRQPRQLLASSSSRRRLLPKLDRAPEVVENNPSETVQPSQPSVSKEMRINPLLLPPDPTSGSLRCNSLTLLLQSFLPSVNVTTRIMHQNKVLMMSMHVFRGLSTDPFRSSHHRQFMNLSSPAPPNARPIDLARSLFQLAICLQQSDRTIETSKLCLGHPHSDVAGQYFEAASRYVTSQDSLVVSFEGIETLMLEGLYHVSTGQLRLAWLVFRRALGIAHLMGLHIPQRRRQGKQPGATNLQASMCLATLWFRLIFMDRYLSLVLCLPMSVRDDSFMDDLVEKEPLEKFERAQAKLTSRIISRNELLRLGRWGNDGIYDHYKETKDIDYLLKQATQSLSPDWWAFPRPQDAQSNAELKDMTAKIVHQLHHYNLVLLLHMPYIVPGLGIGRSNEATQGYSNSKIAAMTAARELLTRSIVPVGPNRVSSSSRGNILKIVLSALALLLAHLDNHRLGRENALGHQRPGDLLMAERAIQSLETVAQKYDDTLCYSAVRALRKMKTMEATAADGAGYIIWVEPSEMMQMECIVQEEENGTQMLFPHVGTIHILRHESQETVPTTSDRLHIPAEAGNLDGSLLTPSWAWSDSPLSSLLPELASATSSTDDMGDISIGPTFANHGMQDAWGLQRGDVECIEALPTSRLFLQDYEFQEWDLNDQRSLILEETVDTTSIGS